MKEYKEIDIENGIMGHDYYLDQLCGLGLDPIKDRGTCLREDGSVYIGENIWLTVDGEYITDEK